MTRTLLLAGRGSQEALLGPGNGSILLGVSRR